ncbi:MAG: replicative helicase [Clostridiales bacterium]|nr:replicative helicase [Clostridiales bacterium]
MEPAIDRIPPHNIEAEQSVLGAMLLDKEAVAAATEVLRKDDFYSEADKELYDAMVSLYETGQPVDLVTVTEQLRKRNTLEAVGGLNYVTALSASVPTTANVDYYIRIVEEKAILRRLIQTCSLITKDSYEAAKPVEDIIDQAEKGIFDISQKRHHGGFIPISQALIEAFDHIEELYKNKGHITGIPTGFVDLDYKTAGFQPSDLILIAARPSMGKTAFALNIAQYAAVKAKIPTAIFSLEMSKEQLVNRLLCAEANVDSHKLRTGNLDEEDWPRLAAALAPLSEAPLYIDDTPAISALELRSKARRLKMEKGLGLIIIDYLQLMQGRQNAENRQQEISEISRSLKALARELNVPVIALSQLSRAPEARTDHRPILSDLRECVTGDTLVMMADGRRIPIKDLVGTMPEVFSVDQRGRIIKAQSDKVWYVGKRPVFDVILASGRHIRATGKHRLLSGSGWKQVSELVIGDRIACARKIPEPRHISSWSEDRVALLGQLIGDGSYLVHQPLRYTTASEENSDIVSSAAYREFGTTVKRYEGRGNWHQLLLSGNGNRWHPNGLNLWLRELGIFGQRSHEKRIPVSVFSLNNVQIALLLRHLWATDGTISPRKNGIGGAGVFFSTCSEGLAFDIAALLLRLEIFARIYKNKKPGYRTLFNVVISGTDFQRKFLESVGAFGPRVEPALQLANTLASKSNTNVDTLPQEWFSYIRKRMREKNISQRKMASMRGTSYGGTSHFRFSPSREVVAQYAEILDDQLLKDAASNDLFWDRIVEILPCGEEDVYDLTVPGPSSWLADGIVSHNSGAMEQDADVVAFLYRDEYYNPDTDKKNIAEVIIAKQRNGPTGIVELVWLGQFTKFANLERQRTPM